jgi:NAD(P)-dependent dehydrogenase (short-subunit alcohol dehydrogenase family)
MTQSSKSLAGQVTLITGGATGIGRAMALALGNAGAKIWIASRDQAAIGRAVDELHSVGVAASGARLDVTNRTLVEALVDRIVTQDGKIDILFNGAGVMIKHPVVQMPEDIWDLVVDVNLKGMFLCTQAVARAMIGRGYGRIINVSSAHAQGNATNSAYSAAKGGLESFTKTFAAELRQLNVEVTINAIEPGGTDTAMWRRGKNTEYIHQALAAGRIHRPDFMRAVVLFLASPASSAVNGEIVSHSQRNWLAMRSRT